MKIKTLKQALAVTGAAKDYFEKYIREESEKNNGVWNFSKQCGFSEMRIISTLKRGAFASLKRLALEIEIYLAEKKHSVLDIKITEKKNMYGEIFEVDSLSISELSIYIDCLVLFEDKKYMVSTIEHIVSEKREAVVFLGKKRI